MKATIDIKTPAGKSLEGFPASVEHYELNTLEFTINSMGWIPNQFGAWPIKTKLNKGDTITIKIEE